MILRMYASDPQFADWNELLTMYAALLNPWCHVNLAGVDTGSVEYRADVVVWREHVKDAFAEVKIMKFLNELENG